MRIDRYLAVAGALGLLFGLFFLVTPALALGTYGMATAPHNLLQSRYFGGTMLAYGLALWLARGTEDRSAGRALVASMVLGTAVGAAVSAWAVSTGLQGPMGWSSVAIYGLLCAGGAVLLVQRRA